MPAPTVRQSALLKSAVANNVSPALALAPLPGVLLVAAIAGAGAALTCPVPSGWTAATPDFFTQAGAGWAGRIFYKTSAGAADQSVTLTCTGATDVVGILAELSAPAAFSQHVEYNRTHTTPTLYGNLAVDADALIAPVASSDAAIVSLWITTAGNDAHYTPDAPTVSIADSGPNNNIAACLALDAIASASGGYRSTGSADGLDHFPASGIALFQMSGGGIFAGEPGGGVW